MTEVRTIPASTAIEALAPLGDAKVGFDVPSAPTPVAPPEPRPAPAPVAVAPKPVAPPTPAPAADPIEAARATGDKRLTRLADRAEKATAALAAALAAHRADPGRRERIAALEAEIRALKGQDRLAAVRGDYPCTRCSRTFTTPQGVSMHRRRAHEGWDPKAARAGVA